MTLENTSTPTTERTFVIGLLGNEPDNQDNPAARAFYEAVSQSDVSDATLASLWAQKEFEAAQGVDAVASALRSKIGTTILKDDTRTIIITNPNFLDQTRIAKKPLEQHLRNLFGEHINVINAATPDAIRAAIQSAIKAQSPRESVAV